MIKTIYHLARPARKHGGDRYETGDVNAPCEILYINQTFSRAKSRKPVAEITVIFLEEGDSDE